MADRVSMVPNAASTNCVDVDVGNLLRAIRNGRWKRAIRTVRRKIQRVLAETGDYKTARRAADACKKWLPAILWSGRFARRANGALIEHSGLICADLDSLNGQLPVVQTKLAESPHVWVMFVSPSGDGLKVIFRVPADAARHVDAFRAFARLVL